MKGNLKSVNVIKRFLLGVGREIVMPIALALIVIQYVIQAFQIPSGSMEDSLLVGDFLLGLKFVYGSPVPFSNSKFPALSAPERGDVVIFRYPGDPEYPNYDSKRYTHLANALMLGNFYWDSNPENGNPHLIHYADGPKDFIKRCVAVSGDTIEIREGVLYLNGVRQDSLPGHGKYTAAFRTYSPRDNLQPLRIPVAGDTLKLDSLSLVDLWRVRSLMVQENPESRIEFDLQLTVNGVDGSEFVFEDFKVPVESDRGLLLQEVFRNKHSVGLVLHKGDTVSGPVPFKFFSSLARTGFIAMMNVPNQNGNGFTRMPEPLGIRYPGFTRPVTYDSFEGSQLGDLEGFVASLNAPKTFADSSAKDSVVADTLATDSLHAENVAPAVVADKYELTRRILVDGKEVHEYVVKEPVYFMMGDNRDNSADSRYWGFVASRNIKAKAFVIYFSFENADQSFSFSNPFSWFSIPFKIRYSRIGKVIPLI